MEAERVIEKILADAKAEAEKIAKEAGDKESAEQAGLAGQLQEYKKQTGILADRAAKDEKSHILAAARMEIAKEFLAEKRKILDEVFGGARQRLQTLPDEEYRGFMGRLLLEAVETGDEEVIVGKDENRIDQQLVNQINQQLSSAGKGNLKLSGERQSAPGGSGFILRRGKIKTNVSFDVLFARVRRELEIELAKELFEK
jgi:V/A-type H+-transporting ATPase subunit E